MSRLKRTVAALALALVIGTGTAHAQQIYTEVWWLCTKYYFGYPVYSEYVATSGSDPSWNYWWEAVWCVHIATCSTIVYPDGSSTGYCEES